MVLAISPRIDEAGDAGFFHRHFHDGVRQALELQIQLEAGDAFFRAGDFAVHVAIRVFPADDVGEELVFGNAVAAVFGADADADAGHGTNHRDAGVHERERAAADGRHRGGTVGFHDLAGDAHGVGIILRAESSARCCARRARRGRFRGGRDR